MLEHFNITNARYCGAQYATALTADCSLTHPVDSRASTNGAFAWVTGDAQVEIRDSFFDNLVADGNGGVVAASGAASVQLVRVTVAGPQAANGGTLHAADESHVDITDAVITHSSATGAGGAVYVVGAATVALSSTQIVEATAANMGGAIAVVSSTAAVKATPFPTPPLFDRPCDSTWPPPNLPGPAASGGPTATLQQCRLHACSAMSSGGAVAAQGKGSRVTLELCNITDASVALEDGVGMGGAIAARLGARADLHDVQCFNSSASAGGCILAASGATLPPLVGRGKY